MSPLFGPSLQMISISTFLFIETVLLKTLTVGICVGDSVLLFSFSFPAVH